MRRDMLAFVASPGASRPVALQAPSREAPGENIPSLINAPVFKQRFPEEATSILTQGARSIKPASVGSGRGAGIAKG